MLKDIVQLTPLEGWRLRLRFEDGVTGEIDVAELVAFHGVFAELKDPAKFRAVRADPELGTIVWPGGADLDPDVLYERIARQPISSTTQQREHQR